MVAFTFLDALFDRLGGVAKRFAAPDVVSGEYETHAYGNLFLKARAKAQAIS